MSETRSDDWQHAIQRHGHTLVVALLAAGVSLDDARDLAQETWTRLMESAAAGRLVRLELPGLAIRQAMFLLAERRRVQGRRFELPQTEAAELPAADASPHQVLESRQLLTVVRAELGRVSVRGQAVVGAVLASNGASHLDLAAQEGVSLQRFRQILCEVRARLRAALNEVTK